MGHQRRTLNKTLNPAQTFGAGEDLDAFEESVSLLEPALHVNGDHAPEVPHLLFGDFVLGVGLQARVGHAGDLGVVVEVLDHRAGVLAVLDDPDLQGFERAQEDVGVEGRHAPPHGQQVEPDFLVELGVAGGDGPADAVRVPADVLGAGVQNGVGPQQNGRLQIRSGEGVVHHGPDVLAARELRNLLDVEHLQRRVGGRLDHDQLHPFVHGLLPLRTAEVDHPDLEAELPKDLVQQPVGPPVHIIPADDHVVLLEHADQTGDRRASGSKNDSVFGAVEPGQAVFKGVDCRVSAASVVEFVVENSGCLLGEGGTEVDWNVD